MALHDFSYICLLSVAQNGFLTKEIKINDIPAAKVLNAQEGVEVGFEGRSLQWVSDLDGEYLCIKCPCTFLTGHHNRIGLHISLNVVVFFIIVGLRSGQILYHVVFYNSCRRLDQFSPKFLLQSVKIPARYQHVKR